MYIMCQLTDHLTYGYVWIGLAGENVATEGDGGQDEGVIEWKWTDGTAVS